MYFSTNQLATNGSKTEILAVPYGSEKSEDLYVMTSDGEIVRSKNQVKILGIRFNSKNDMSTHVTTIASTVGMAYKKLQPYISHANTNQRKIIIKSKVESIALYGSALFFNESKNVKKRLSGILKKIISGF